MTGDDLIYKIAFSMLHGINYSAAEHIIGRTGSEKAFFEAPEGALRALLNITSRFVSSSYRSELLEKACKEALFVESSGIYPVYFSDSGFPERLKDCEDAPVMLYSLGDCNLNTRFTISIVGTRHATSYGLGFTRRLIEDLADMLPEKPLVISGLAFGIDIEAHRGAMECGCPTAAVLAHGLNTIYPAVHRNYAADICRKGGVLLTEYTSSATIHRGSFLARNRIIAGLAECTVIVESARKGGAMTTARIARDYNRDVFALPGRISDPYSAGCNALINNKSAELIQSAQDLVYETRWPVVTKEGQQQSLLLELNDDEQKIVDILTQHGDTQLNRLSILCSIPVHRLMATLVDMEFKGVIITYPGGRYALA